MTGVIVPRAIWKASIQFGPVSVPVKLYPAVKDVRRRSHLLHDQDRERLPQRMVCLEESLARTRRKQPGTRRMRRKGDTLWYRRFGD